jgi:hypothetical protein
LIRPEYWPHLRFRLSTCGSALLLTSRSMQRAHKVHQIMTIAVAKNTPPQKALRLASLGRVFAERLGRAIVVRCSRCARSSALLACFVWLVLSIAGVSTLGLYELTPGEATTVQSQWPDGVDVTPNIDGPTLILFVHPRCPCTRASLGELKRILDCHRGSLCAYVIAFRPAFAEESWEHTDLWRAASTLPGARLASDVDGMLARRFGATTSGHAMLYDESGRLLFDGGITSARGYQGDNAGGSAITALLTGGGHVVRTTPVFGCPIVPAATDQTGKQ